MLLHISNQNVIKNCIGINTYAIYSIMPSVQNNYEHILLSNHDIL